MTYPLILAKIPVKNPWEIFASPALRKLERLPRHTGPDGRDKILV